MPRTQLRKQPANTQYLLLSRLPLQAQTLPMILSPPFRSLIAQVGVRAACHGGLGRQVLLLLASSAMYSGLFARPSPHRAAAHSTLPPPRQAHNGSGKTTCFTLGMLGRVDTQLQAPQVRSPGSRVLGPGAAITARLVFVSCVVLLPCKLPLLCPARLLCVRQCGLPPSCPPSCLL